MLKQKNPDTYSAYHQAVRYVESFNRLGQANYMKRKPGQDWSVFLHRTCWMLRQIGNPEKKLPNVIHVAGSNGKGSVATMIHEILTANGQRSGLYTSPFTTTTIEKFRVGQQLMGPGEFVALVERLKPALDAAHSRSPYGQPSYFEICTAIAFLYFVEKKCDACVIEVGLGGEFDSTNVIPSPRLAIINSISLDHTQLLGRRISQIAQAKAGIIKPGTTVLTCPQVPAAKRVIRERCQKLNVPLVEVGPPTRPFALCLEGKQQQQNAALAVAAAQELGIGQRAIITGLRRAWLPCRFEIMQRRPLVILDGAHNPEKIKSVIGNLEKLTYKKLYLIIAVTHDRNPRVLFKRLLPYAKNIFFTRFLSQGRKPLAPNDLERQLKRFARGAQTNVYLDPSDALQHALRLAGPHDLVLVTGSLFLTGELRTHWVSEAQILKQRHA